VELYTRHFNKVGYSTESRSTGVGRLALRNQMNCHSKNQLYCWSFTSYVN